MRYVKSMNVLVQMTDANYVRWLRHRSNKLGGERDDPEYWGRVVEKNVVDATDLKATEAERELQAYHRRKATR